MAIAGILQETNTFSPVATRREEFQWTSGSELIAVHRNENSEIHGFLDALGKEGAEIVPVLGAWAVTQGRIRRRDLDDITGELTAGIRRAGPLDGVLLALHGAWAGEDVDSCDAYVLSHVRAEIGVRLPLMATLDLHGNITRAMCRHADALVGYQTCPHVDTYETGVRAGKLLLAALNGQIKPVMAMCKIPMVVQAENMISERGEFRSILEFARALESRPGVVSASIFAVQPWLDVEELGWASVVVTDNDDQGAVKSAAELAQYMWSLRQSFVIPLPTVGEALDRAMAVEGGPVVLAEGADGTMGGGPGDGTAILAGILARGLDVPTAAFVVDSEAVRKAVEAGAGASVTLSVGGKLDRSRARAVRVTGRVERISDGEFRYKGRAYTGRLVRMGKAVVLAIGKIRLLIAERAAPTTDPELYRSQGIEPTTMKLVLVKSPLGARLEYEPISRDFLSVNSPGCCSPDLRSLPFERIPRPIFPFDPVEFAPAPFTRTRELGARQE